MSSCISFSFLHSFFYKFVKVSEWCFTDRRPSVLCSALSDTTACCLGERLMSGTASWRAAGCLQLWRCSSSSPPASVALTAPRWSTTSTLFTMSTTEVRLGFILAVFFFQPAEFAEVVYRDLRGWKLRGKTDRMKYVVNRLQFEKPLWILVGHFLH